VLALFLRFFNTQPLAPVPVKDSCLALAATTILPLVTVKSHAVTHSVHATVVFPLAAVTTNLSVFTFKSPVAFNVQATTVLPVAPATVNLSVFIVISDVADPIKESPAPNVTHQFAVIPPVNTDVQVTARVPLTAVLPVAHATVNLSVFIVIFDVEDQTRSSQAHNITHPVIAGLPLTLNVPVITALPVTARSQVTAKSSPTNRSSAIVSSHVVALKLSVMIIYCFK
jgi:hypothetical protein